MSVNDTTRGEYMPVTLDSTAQRKRKEYIPATLHTLTLLGYAAICLGLIAVLEALIRTKALQGHTSGGFLPIKRDAIEGWGEHSPIAYEPYGHVIGRKLRQRFEPVNITLAEPASFSTTTASSETHLSSVHPPTTQTELSTLEETPKTATLGGPPPSKTSSGGRVPSSTMQRSIQSISESSRLQAESTSSITSRTRNYFKLRPTLYAPSVGVNPEQVTSPTTAAIPSTISSDVDVVSVETLSGNANPTTTTPDVKTGNGPDERKPPKFGYKSGVPMFRPVEEYPTDVDLTPTPTATTVHVDPEVSPPNDVITVANIKKVSATQNKPSLPRTTVDTLSADLRGGGGQSIPAVTLVQVNTKFTKTYEGPLLTVDTTDKNGLPTKLLLIESPKHNAPLAPVTIDAEFIRTYRGPIHTVLTMNRDGAPITMLMVESTIRPIDAKITPSVTMVAVDGKIAETYRGVIQTLDTTDQNGKPTTLLMVESTIVPTPSVTMITVDSKFAKTYQGSIRTVHTTNKDGNPTTLLMIESTIDPNNAPSVTLAADNNFEETYVADGRLQTIGTTNADGSSTTMLMFEVPITTTGTQTASNASATAPSTQPTKSSTNLNDVLGYRVIYFGAHYLPTLLAVVLSMFWKIIDTDIKRIEPFYLLSHPAGTTAETLTENLLFGNSMIIPFQAAWRRQWIVCLSAIIYCPLLTGVQFLASSAISLTTHRKCDGFAKKRTCGIPFVMVQSSAARVLQGVLGAVVLAVIAIVLLQRRRKSLLHSEPWSLAGLATMLADWGATRTAFSRIRVSDSEEDLKRTVMGRKNKYRLVETTYHEKPHLGIELVGDPNEATSTDMEVMDPESETSEIYRRQERSRRPPMLKTATLIIFTLFLCGMLSVILIYSLTYSSLIEHFMSGQGRGVNILFIALGVTVRFGWEPIDREARHLEVFHALSHRHRPVSTLLRDHPRSFPVVTEVVNLINGNFFIVAIGLIGLFVEALVVSLTGIPYSGTETWEDARTCMILSSLIIAIIIITIILTMIRRRRLERRLPRVPYTLATVMGYIYAARMLESFAGLSVLPTKERNCKIVEIGRGREYGFGWTVGNDEARRVGVDEEELEADYKRQQAIDSKW